MYRLLCQFPQMMISTLASPTVNITHNMILYVDMCMVDNGDELGQVELDCDGVMAKNCGDWDEEDESEEDVKEEEMVDEN